MEKLLIEKSIAGRKGYTLPALDVPAANVENCIPKDFLRSAEPNMPELPEIDVARHFVKLSHLNHCIEEGLYPLGSCTMKYNPKINETIAGLPGFAELHPCTEPSKAQGALRLMYELGESLKEMSGLPGVSLQPSAGSNGEFTGIMCFRAYHHDRGDFKRTKILIPDSAHGTNPASAVVAGFSIVAVNSEADGKIDLKDLAAKCGDDVAGFMLTNPNTLGLFETNIVEIEKLIHGCGGLMYMDGANLNALLGITRPGDMKFDCVHINLHKTFATPHGGGGPGAGPICVSEKLVPFLPVPQVVKNGDKYDFVEDCPKSIGKMHTFFGNFGVLVRAYAYIAMLGKQGIPEISRNAIINANYLLSRLKNDFDAPYASGPCMHEFVLSGDRQKEMGANTKDIAKRLLDYGFHAPTIYFPLIVHESMLVEPTETETKESIDAFADAMLAINNEIKDDPEFVRNAPYSTPVKRLDDALAARNLNIHW